MNTCPCCLHPMLRHINGHHLYWFCRHCWEEMPVLDVTNPKMSLGQSRQKTTPSDRLLIQENAGVLTSLGG